MPSHAFSHARHLLIAAALGCGLAGCGKKAEEPAEAAQGYYQCLFRGVYPKPNLDFVIRPRRRFHAFNTEAGIYTPGTYTLMDGVLTFSGSPLDGIRMRAEPDTDDHSGPFRMMDGNTPKPFLCSWKAFEPPSLQDLRRAVAASRHPPAD